MFSGVPEVSERRITPLPWSWSGPWNLKKNNLKTLPEIWIQTVTYSSESLHASPFRRRVWRYSHKARISISNSKSRASCWIIIYEPDTCWHSTEIGLKSKQQLITSTDSLIQHVQQCRCKFLYKSLTKTHKRALSTQTRKQTNEQRLSNRKFTVLFIKEPGLLRHWILELRWNDEYKHDKTKNNVKTCVQPWKIFLGATVMMMMMMMMMGKIKTLIEDGVDSLYMDLWFICILLETLCFVLKVLWIPDISEGNRTTVYNPMHMTHVRP